MKNKTMCLLSVLAASFLGTACASAPDGEIEGAETQVDVVRTGKAASPEQSESEVKPQNVPAACSALDWATANGHAAANHSMWSPGSGWHFAHATSCSVSGNMIYYSWAVEY